MSDANKLSLARAIHGTPHATRDSFSPSTWAGVERAWAWVEKRYQPKEPTVKQEPTIYGAPIIEDKYLPPGHGLVGVNVSAFETPTPPWTDAQREAADDLVGIIARKMKRLDPETVHTEAHAEVCAEIARIAPMFVEAPSVEFATNGDRLTCASCNVSLPKPSTEPFGMCDACVESAWKQPAPSVEECERAYHRAWRASAYPHMQNAMVTRNESAGIAAVRALMMQGDGGGAAQRVVEPHSSTDGGGSARSEASASSGVVSTEATVASKGLPPSPASGVAPWPDRMDIARLVRKTRFDYVNERDWHGEPASVDFMHADAALTMFAPALRTRDERIAEHERNIARWKDEEASWKEIDDLRLKRIEEADERIAELERRLAKTDHAFDIACKASDAKSDTIATLTKERDEASAKIDKMHPRLDGLADFYKCAREVCDGFNTDKPLAEALRLLRSGYDNVCEDAKTLRARVAELEKRGAADVSDRANKDQRKRIDALCKTMSVKEYSTEIDRDDVLALLSDLSLLMKYGNPSYRTRVDIAEKLDAIPRRWHTRPVRRITREEVIDMAEAHAKDWREYKLPISAMTEALRAIGFEVDA